MSEQRHLAEVLSAWGSLEKRRSGKRRIGPLTGVSPPYHQQSWTADGRSKDKCGLRLGPRRRPRTQIARTHTPRSPAIDPGARQREGNAGFQP
jgi:hypothetical protein